MANQGSISMSKINLRGRLVLKNENNYLFAKKGELCSASDGIGQSVGKMPLGNTLIQEKML